MYGSHIMCVCGIVCVALQTDDTAAVAIGTLSNETRVSAMLVVFHVPPPVYPLSGGTVWVLTECDPCNDGIITTQ